MNHDAETSGGPHAPPRLVATTGRRIQSIDTLRGFALLGILIMNIPFFAAPYVLENPTAYPANGSFVGGERWIWSLSHIVADQKFMTLFSPLYGAGILLLTLRREERGRPAGALFLFRSLWLLLFGLLHYFLLWDGDILMVYALTGMGAFLVRRHPPAMLLALGLILLSVHMFIMLGVPEGSEELVRELERDFHGDPEYIAHSIEIFQGPYAGQIQYRFWEFGDFFLFLFGGWAFWRAGGLMLMGMAALKWGVLTAERSDRFYLALALLGMGCGWLTVAGGLWDKMHRGWDFYHVSFGLGYLYNYWGSLLVSAGYIGAVMLAERREWLPSLRARLTAVGRMAFTHYILHSLICGFIFYGYGLGLYAQVNRAGQMGIVLAIWLFQLWISPWWLARFRFGPLEWLWRTLTYRTSVPFRQATP